MQFMCALPLVFVLAACSSGGDGGGGGTTPAASPSVGVFIDSPVQGLGYNATPSGLSGLTNASGQYNYLPGDTVTFNLYGRSIGAAVTAGPVVTGLSVFNATSIADPRVVNLAQLLLTLGGGIPAGTNPIQVPATAPGTFPKTLNFSDPAFDTSFPGLIQEALANMHLQANFSTLSVTLAGSGSGSVTSNPTGLNCGATCSADFSNGTAVTLTATGTGFTGWSGGCTGTGACVVTLNANTVVTATFSAVPGNANLTVTKAGNGAGTVTSSPAGINCGATCSASLVQGTVDLTATAATGSTFAGWSSGTGNANCTGTNTCGIPLTVDSTVIATFTLNAVPVSVTANIASGNSGGGTVTCSADGGGAGPCGSYLPGTAMVMTATPNSVSNFTGWTATVCSGTGTCDFTVTSATTVTANFNRPILTVQVTGTGSVSSNPTGINSCTANCPVPFNKGVVTLTASGTGFTGWSGGGCLGTAPCVVTLNQNTTITATFGGGGTSAGRVVYQANADKENIFDMYLAQAGTVTRLGSPTVFPNGRGDDSAFEVLPNWTGVVYKALPVSGPLTLDLYRTNFTSPGLSQQLTAVSPFAISDFKVFPDNSGVVFGDGSGLFWTSFSSPGTSTQLIGASSEFELIPNRSGVVSRSCGLSRVNFSDPTVSQAITPASINTCSAQSPSPLRIWHVLPDSSGVVFEQIEQGPGAPSVVLYLIRFANPGVAQRLSSPPGQGQSVAGWKALPDSTGVVFASGSGDGLYRVRFMNPGVAERITPASGDGSSAGGFEFTLDGSAVVYGLDALYKVSLASPGVSQKLTPTLGVIGCTTGNISVCRFPFQMTPDGTGVVFAVFNQFFKIDLYRVNFATPGTAQLLNPAPAAGQQGIFGRGGLYSPTFQLTTDGTGVVYAAQQDTGSRELYRVNFSSPGVSTKLNGPLEIFPGVTPHVQDFRAE